jgi:hypothetical protein
LKDRWGSQKARLTRESFLPLASCHLCLQPARDPVSCSVGGHIFCRECALANLLAQRKEIQRLEKEDERRREEEVEAEREKDEEAKEGVVRGFERAMMGLGEEQDRLKEDTVETRRERKRKFELDEEEIRKNAEEDRARARRKLDEEKVCILFTQTPNANDTSPQKLHCRFGCPRKHLLFNQALPHHGNSTLSVHLPHLKKTLIPYLSKHLSQSHLLL